MQGPSVVSAQPPWSKFPFPVWLRVALQDLEGGSEAVAWLRPEGRPTARPHCRSRTLLSVRLSICWSTVLVWGESQRVPRGEGHELMAAGLHRGAWTLEGQTWVSVRADAGWSSLSPVSHPIFCPLLAASVGPQTRHRNNRTIHPSSPAPTVTEGQILPKNPLFWHP